MKRTCGLRPHRCVPRRSSRIAAPRRAPDIYFLQARQVLRNVFDLELVLLHSACGVSPGVAAAKSFAEVPTDMGSPCLHRQTWRELHSFVSHLFEAAHPCKDAT